MDGAKNWKQNVKQFTHNWDEAMTTAELKEMWREENWERKVNQIPRIKWSDFIKRTWVQKELKGSKSCS
jgi:hypothetical protein